MEFSHKPIMLNECMDGLNLKNGGIYFDGTLGGAGHSFEILKRTSPNGRLVGVDRDLDALEASSKRLECYNTRINLVHDNFKNIKNILSNLNIDKIDGAIIDLGVSSYQLDNRERGFSYLSRDTILDMRMDKTQKFSAKELINTYSEQKLEYILSTFGEEMFSKRIAKEICLRRNIKPIETTGELVDICEYCIPAKFKKDGHPAKRTFQAVRIAVNEELEGLDQALRDIVDCLNSGGRFTVLTFHSLEDRIVKTVFKDLQQDCICDKRYPCVCGRKRIIREINKKPIVACEDELKDNSRAKCAKLRIIEKI